MTPDWWPFTWRSPRFFEEPGIYLRGTNLCILPWFRSQR